MTTIIFLLVIVFISFVEAKNIGFSVDLIHRDSSSSPFYNPLETPSDRWEKAIRRSIVRINHFNPTSISPNDIQLDLFSRSGEYLLKLSIGTPPFEIIGLADTGSDLLWTQCNPCPGCYMQRAPLFDPLQSSTYKDLACGSEPCVSLGGTTCTQNVCNYTYAYGDRSITNGNLAAETFTFGSTNEGPVAIPNIAFGCGHNNTGTFDENMSGLIGLGHGPLSLISQLGPTIGRKFSYCLAPSTSNVTGKMNFGSQAVVSGAGVVSIPLLVSQDPTYYVVTLEGISVGDNRLAYKNGLSADANDGGNGINIIIDSGTPPTLLPSQFYYSFVSALKNGIDLPPAPIADPNGLCYNTTTELKVPKIIFHFTGADVELNAENTFIRVQNGLVCIVMMPVENGGIFGGISQTNFLIGYDLESNTVSFKRTDCTQNN